ncbi:hypothetical protein VXL85_10885 [Phaeobacter sp. JH60H1]|uniref:hypothetical protein n=1 Tax=unclassified Phaeobacter TaxID=2621772 RepID=UPI003A8882E8
MPIFELEKNDLANLTDGQLEELVARLSEAEVARAQHPVSCVRWMGALTAPDGGIDVQVVVPDENFCGDFVPRPETVFQVKKPSMPPAKIAEEMTGKDNAKELFGRLNTAAGAFVIVSLGDDTAPPNYQARKNKMEAELSALVGDPNVHVDFYDRSRLAQWLRQHVSVQLWVRKILGKKISCWRPFEKWTATPEGTDDSVIFHDGIAVSVPGQTSELSLEDAIPAARELIKASSKAIRIAGLSGVGKTRFVQAFFEDVGATEPLDRTTVIYADIGDGPDPSATNLLDTLIADQRDVILVLDNCPSDLHGSLAARLASKGKNIKLVTIEYDIREDKPQTTEVIRIKAHGPEIAERLVARRHPKLSGPNSRRIAEFAEGNCRLSLALADAAPSGESLAELSDGQLFERLFYQRHDSDKDLKEQAEALSLVYSFSVQENEEGIDELAILGGVCEHSRRRMHRAAQTLVDRQLAQQRGPWRAVLPHAIANRLAADALRNIPESEILEIFEAKAGLRLLKSFSRRLGYLHEHDVAKNIVEKWLQEGGILNKFLSLNEHGAEMLMHVAPVSPELVLEQIETQIDEIVAALSSARHHPRRVTVLTLLAKIAYDPGLFERSMMMLLRFAVEEGRVGHHDDARSKIKSFFGLLHSGTHASTEQRLAFVKFCLEHDDASVVEVGLSLLTETLRTERFSGTDTSDFGARPRDFGWRPNHDESVEWLQTFLAFAEAIARGGDAKSRRVARSVLAERFRELWRIRDLQEVLPDVARNLNADSPWLEGWRGVRSILHFARISKVRRKQSETEKDLLEALERELKPSDLAGEIRALVLGSGQKIWSLDDEFDPDDPQKYRKSAERQAKQAFELGRVCCSEEGLFDLIAGDLFEPIHAPYRQDFGRGLVAGSPNARATWDQLVIALRKTEVEHFSFDVLSGALQEIGKTNKSLASQILDECATDELLQPCIIRLHPFEDFNEVDFDRCLTVLKQAGQPQIGIGSFLWRSEYDVVSTQKMIELAEEILASEGGASELLEAYSMKLHGKDQEVDTLGLEHRRLGLISATQLIANSDSDPGGSKDYSMQKVLRACLSFEGNDKQKNALMDGLFERVANSYGFFSDFEGSIQVIAEHLPKAFLERALLDTSIEEYKRFGLFRNSAREIPPLAGIPPEQLVQWCQEGNDQHRWNLIAQVISSFDKSANEAFSLSKQAYALLETAPDPNLVVDGFLEHLSPSSWWGSLAEQIAVRAKSMEAVLEHSNQKVRDAAVRFLARAKEAEDRERDWEAKRNKDKEQSFE